MIAIKANATTTMSGFRRLAGVDRKLVVLSASSLTEFFRSRAFEMLD
jgi:hypothetical protein